jgi:hypothetical protein
LAAVLALRRALDRLLDRRALRSCTHHIGPVFSDLDQAVVVSTAAEARTTSRWIAPLAALGATIAVALRSFARRDRQLVRAAYAVRQRLVRACRRAPPSAVALHTF